MTDKYYVEKQLRFYETAPCEAAKDDALYRLGTHSEIIPLTTTAETLTPEERETVLRTFNLNPNLKDKQ